MTLFKPSDDDYKILDEELEEIKKKRAAEETRELAKGYTHLAPSPLTNKEKDELKRTFENLSYRLGRGNNNDDPNPNGNSYNGNTNNDDGDDQALDLADELIKKYHIKTVSANKEIYYFDSKKGVYLPHAEILIESELESRYVQELKSAHEVQRYTIRSIAELIGQIQRRTYIDISTMDAQKEWLACADCMLNLTTGETASFDPKYLNTTQIPVKYHLSARTPVTDFWYYTANDPLVDSCPCPDIMKFLNEIMAPEDVEIILDFMAFCLWREYKFHNWLLLNGSGQNGKSTLLRLIDRFFGHQNVSSESLDRLLTRTFAPAGLYHKLVNIDADISADYLLHNTGRLKKLTGNDEITAEFKYGQPFKFVNYAKPIFSCNEIPETPDKTDAFFRRLIIINFTQQFFGNKEDANYIDKLTTEKELSGLLYELLRRLPRVLEKGIRQTTNETIRDTVEKYTRGSNPVNYFVEVAIRRANNNLSKHEAYESYSRFCSKKGLPIESEQSFSRKLKELGFQYKLTRTDNNGREYCWEGIELKDWKVLEDKDQETLDSEDIGELTEAEREALK